MKKTKNIVAASVLACSAMSGLVMPMSGVYAEGTSSFFDLNAEACIIENYNLENSTSITSLDDEEFDRTKLTVLNCPNKELTNLRGITQFPNLIELDVSGNSKLNLAEMDFSQNEKLEIINVSGVNSDSMDLSNNPEIKSITIDHDMTVKTPAYVERMSKEKEYTYGMDLSGLKFLDEIEFDLEKKEYPYEYDEENKTITFKTNIPYSVPVKMGEYDLDIEVRSGFMSYALELKDGEEVEVKDSTAIVDSNCDKIEGTYHCTNVVYTGDTFDSSAVIKDFLEKAFDLKGYILSEVNIVPPTANVKLTTDEKTVKKGEILPDAMFSIQFVYEKETIAPPDTGAFTDGGKTVVAVTATAGFVAVLIACYISSNAIKRAKAKVDFKK